MFRQECNIYYKRKGKLMKTIFFVLIFVLSCLGYAQVGWFNQNSGVNNPLFDVHFVDDNNGWIAGNTGLILHTSNGGINWEVQNAPPNNTYYSIYFTDNQNGWAGGYSGKLIRTTDGGANWIDGSAGTNRYRYDLYFLNAVRDIEFDTSQTYFAP